ncbi:MAG TPA: hypothetical protein PLD20_24495 [Blastocatellia bacterium]|nr:hypothetical protein [Blastocatellia bacterium]HMZ21116.1 hypothetical protein [Blastocatellia bacterium]
MPKKRQPEAKKPSSNNEILRFENEVQPKLDTLALSEKVRFLKECIINFEHDTLTHIDLMLAELNDGYYMRCQKALKKYEQLAALDDQRAEKELVSPTSSKNPDFTTARQVLAVHYLLKAAGMRADSVDKSNVARLIEFLTGKNYRNIYDCVRDPFKISDRETAKDLKFIKPYFEKLGMTQITTLIEKELKFTATE